MSLDGYSRAMGFAAAKAKRDELEASHKAASEKLKAIPGVGSGAFNMTPDHVRATAEWKQAKAATDHAFAQLRDFNGRFTRVYAAELAEERKNRKPKGQE